jgi:hypothetical protein
MKVANFISGSNCVVILGEDHYLDARKDTRRPHLTFIEVVRNGQVYKRDTVDNNFAPERIVNIIEELE